MTAPEPVASRWDDQACQGFSEARLLLYRSNLLGADLRVTNFAGGNTSAKIAAQDPLTDAAVTVLWVKGSGGDLGSMQLDGFATLYLDRLHALKQRYRGRADEDRMVGLLPHCTFGLNPRPASIDTPLHAFVPHVHVDHVHPDSVIALAAARDGEELVNEAFGGTIGWLPWQRPGFDLGLVIERLCAEQPGLKGVVLGGHGMMTWDRTSKDCYLNTLRVIRQAEEFLVRRGGEAVFGGATVFGGVAAPPAAESRRREQAAELMPALRGQLCGQALKVGHFVDAPDVLEFVGSRRLEELARRGTSCPDHFLRTKIRPLLLDARDPLASLPARLADYRRDYSAYYERCRRPDSPALRDPDPVVLLLPGTGMFTFARDKATARIAAEFYQNAIHVMRGSTLVSDYVGLPEQEAFDIEYWALEEAKLRRMPAPKALAARIAVITGGAGGIGRAAAERMLQDGACVMLLDIDEPTLATTAVELGRIFGQDHVRAAPCDVTREDQVAAAFAATARSFGGVDIVVSNAGIASSAPLPDTTLELWNKNLAILATGYFLISREAFRLMKRQGLGGSIVFVGSKNALAASTQAAAYNTAKAAELHLMRCLALEGAPLGIRANAVNPDAVLRGSRIWSGEWRQQRAAAYGVEDQELEEHYRKRSLLQRSVYPEDVAEAICFFASERSAKSTGNLLNVDAGNVTAFPR